MCFSCEKNTGKFHIGDSVKINYPNSTWHGKIGKIILFRADDTIKVAMDENDLDLYFLACEKEIELVEKAPEYVQDYKAEPISDKIHKTDIKVFTDGSEVFSNSLMRGKEITLKFMIRQDGTIGNINMSEVDKNQ